MIYTSYQRNPVWPSGASLDVTGGIEVMHRNAVLLERLTRDGNDATCAHAYRVEPVRTNPLPYGRWAFLMRAGLTSLEAHITYDGNAAGATPRLRIKVVGGATLLETDPLPSGDEYYTVDISALSDGVIEIALEIYDAGAPADLEPPDGWGVIELRGLLVRDASATVSRTWPTAPTFTSGPGAASLTQLCACLDYLAERVAAVPRPLFMSLAHATGTFSDAENPWQHLRLGGARGSLTRLRVEGRNIPRANAEQIRITVDGTEEAISSLAGPTTTPQAISLDADVSGYADLAFLRLAVQQVVDTAGARPSRLSITRVWFDDAGAPASVPALPGAETLSTWGDARDYLNALSTLVDEIYSRVQADPWRFEYQNCFRVNYGYDRQERAYYGARHLAYGRRRGSRLIVRGRGVSIGWGAPSWSLVNDEEEDGPYNLQSAYEETLIGGTAWDEDESAGVETRLVYLDEVGLPPGVRYVLQGEVRYAAELL